jgi:hypothetical protein
MVITCSLPEEMEEAPVQAAGEKATDAGEKKKVKGHAVCSHCGNEADMWIDI